MLTKTLRGFGLLARWVSRSAICTPLTPSRRARRPQSSRVFGSSALFPEVDGEVDQRLLDEPGHHAGIGAAAGNGGCSAGIGAPLGEHRLAQRVVGARLRPERLVEIEAGPGLDDGVDVERADLAAEAHDVERGGVDREIDAEALAASARQAFAQHVAIVVAGDRQMQELDAALVEQHAVRIVGIDDDETRSLSKSKWRSISGRVPLPIEPKPIITIGPSMRAWRGQCDMASILQIGEGTPRVRRGA